MNKKLIIGIVVAVVVIAGGVYLYNRNKPNHLF
jgi:flagellar motor component MotA